LGWVGLGWVGLGWDDSIVIPAKVRESVGARWFYFISMHVVVSFCDGERINQRGTMMEVVVGWGQVLLPIWVGGTPWISMARVFRDASEV
jgi:hypothetical protein